MTQLLKWISLTAGKGHPSGTNPLRAIRASKVSRVLTRNVSENSNLYKGVFATPFLFQAPAFIPSGLGKGLAKKGHHGLFFMSGVLQSERAY
jgi:hypothetical protein